MVMLQQMQMQPQTPETITAIAQLQQAQLALQQQIAMQGSSAQPAAPLDPEMEAHNKEKAELQEARWAQLRELSERRKLEGNKPKILDPLEAEEERQRREEEEMAKAAAE